MRRRTVLKAGAASAAVAVAGGPFQGLLAPARATRRTSSSILRPAPDQRDGVVRLHLPEGFAYRSFHDTESTVTLDDGTRLPGRHDGMGAFRGPNGHARLVRNHEVNNAQPAFGPGEPYDAEAGGGCTSVEVTPYGEVVSASTSLNGTMMNCSGGVMPWGSWVTCEETVNGPDVGPDFTGAPNLALEKPHGFIFEVPSEGQADREPITRAGRFAHEAVAYDPVEGCLYLTEDNFGYPSGFYRYRPRRNPMATGRLDNEGRLQMLAVKGQPGAHLEARQWQRATYQVEWVDIEHPDPVFPYTPGVEAPTGNDDALCYVGEQGRAQGAAGFSRLEGQVYDDGVVYFCSTQGGGAPESGQDSVGGYGNGHGQVWAYRIASQTLQLLYQSPDRQTLDFPDNITTSASGTLVVCEDSDDDNYLRGLSRSGQLWDIALNRLVGRDGEQRYDDEFAGTTFATDGHTLFVNVQASAGLTYAIWGPWQRIGV